MLERTILFDLCHNEMLNIEEEEFSDFASLLKHLNLKIKRNETDIITQKILQNVDILVIGNPIDDYFSNIEIKTILDYVRVGGNLLILSEYGADYLQKTNLNDITGKNLGFFFEKNLIKEKKENKDSSIIHIRHFERNEITNGLREIIIGGTCSLFLNKAARPLLKTNEKNVWSEVFSSTMESWIKEKEQQQVIAAFTEYGQGKVVVMGDIDIFTNDTAIGINVFDNHHFIQNTINWLLKPVKDPNVMAFTLNQIGTLQNNVKEINNTVNNIIETMTILEKRISFLEEKLNFTSISKKKETDIESGFIEED
jgi:hypothetical protein